jgi:hypothetical protein
MVTPEGGSANMQDELFRLRLQLVQARLRVKEKELALRERELQTKSASDNRPHLLSSATIIVGILAALLGFLGNVAATYLAGRSSLALEQKKFTSALIVESIKTGNPDTAATNLKFFIDMGFLEDADGKISQYVLQKRVVPVLPAPSLGGGSCPEGTCRCATGGCSKACCPQ